MKVLMVTQAPFERVERDSLRLAAVLILAGVVVRPLPDSFIQKVQTRMTTEPFFAIYAASQSWTAVHLGQFIGMVIITFGFVALFLH
jgi:hypothetical protein